MTTDRQKKEPLSITHPGLVEEWDFERNASLTPNDVTAGSSKKVWWKCHICGNSWSAKVFTRTQGHGCLYCGRARAKRRTRKTNEEFTAELERLFPNVAPCDEYVNAHTFIRCQCKICGKTWKTKPNWLLSGHGCPDCGRKLGGEKLRSNDSDFKMKMLQTNTHITPLEPYVLSSKKIKCKCDVCGNIWSSTPNNLLRGSGCPKCNRVYQTSFQEQAILFYIKKLFPDAIGRDTQLIGMELDIYIPSAKTAIEYDGKHWHKGEHSAEKEKKKYQTLKEREITLIRVKEEIVGNSEIYADRVFIYEVERKGFESLNSVITQIIESLGKSILVNIEQDQYLIQEQYFVYRRDNCLALSFPEALEEWYQEKNGSITPYMVHSGSSTRYWWRCKECGYIWKTAPIYRVRTKSGCPKCSKTVLKTNSEFLSDLRKVNDRVLPLEEYKGAEKKILCRCTVCDNVWNVKPINLLKGHGCPQCYLSTKRKDENKFIDEVKEKNPAIEVLSDYLGSRQPLKCRCRVCGYEYQTTPQQLLAGRRCRKCAGTAKKTNEEFVRELAEAHPDIVPLEEYQSAHHGMQLKCAKCGYVWTSTPHSILSNSGNCPACIGRVVIEGKNDLATLRPDLVKEWDYDKNNGITPQEISLGSNQKIHWKCALGHCWETRVPERVKGTKCPVCSGRKVLVGFNDFATICPEIAREWNFEKNAELLPTEFTAKSKKKVWWRCSAGHEWMTSIAGRTNGNGCPYCSKYAPKPVLCIETGIVYQNCTEAMKATGAKKVGECCKGNRNESGGYHWKYYDRG